jgi:hypothetical protein
MFEFDLFAFSYYLLYLETKSVTYMDQLYIKILSFYGPLSRSIIGVLDPIEVEIFDRIMPDKETFVKQKVESYRNGIRNHKKDVRTIGKYAFTSFYISPLIMNAELLKNRPGFKMRRYSISCLI